MAPNGAPAWRACVSLAGQLEGVSSPWYGRSKQSDWQSLRQSYQREARMRARRRATVPFGFQLGRALAVVVLLSYASASHAAIPAAERQALIDLYTSTNGSRWTNRTNWRNTGDTGFGAPGTECTWYGVTCDAGQTTVRRLDFPENYLVGGLPVSLGTLTNLQVLNLDWDRLTGSIPAELAHPHATCRSSTWSATSSRARSQGSLAASRTCRTSTCAYNQLTGSIPRSLATSRTCRTSASAPTSSRARSRPSLATSRT